MTFFEAYRQYTLKKESPDSYFVWSAIAATSTLLGKKCVIPQGIYSIHPNLYILLVGPAGLRKSTALKVGKDLVKTMERNVLAPDSTTREALINKMLENKVEYSIGNKNLFYNQASAFVDEMSEFIGGKHINSSMLSFLTAVYTATEFEYETKNQGKAFIKNPYFTLLGACTTPWLIRNLKSELINDGFSRRTIFVQESEVSTYNSWPQSTPEEMEAWAVMRMEAKRINSISGTFRFTQEALEAWDPFYISLQKSIKNYPDNLQRYYSTKHSLVLQVCMCVSALYNSDMVVDSKLLQLVLDLFEDMESKLPAIFNSMGRNELKQYQVKLYELIADIGPVDRSEILKAFSADLTAAEFEESISVLIQMGMVETDNSLGFNKVNYKAKKRAEIKKPKDLFKLLLAYKPATNETILETGQQVASNENQQKEASARLDQMILTGLLLKGKAPSHKPVS